MPELESSGSILMALAAVALLFAAAGGLGRLFVRPSATLRWSHPDALLLRLVAGFNLLGWLAVLLGMTGFLQSVRPPWILAGFSLLILPDLRSIGRDWPAGQIVRLSPGASWWPWAALTPLAGVTLGPALCYPTGWDELVYHQVLPRRWLADGWPAIYRDLPYSGFPSLGEILFWVVEPIDGVIAPRLLVWVCWMLGLLCLYRMLRGYLAHLSAAVLTLVFTLNDTVLLISANCYVESMLMMNIAAVLLALGLPRRRAIASSNCSMAALLGVLAGGAAGAKLTGWAIILVPLVWYLIAGWVDTARRQAAARQALMYLITAVVITVPFYYRPWSATGNPFYPYLCDWFTSDPARTAMSQHHHAISGYTYGVRTLAAFVDAPLLLAFRASNYDGEFGWQLLVLIVLAVVAVVSAVRRRTGAATLWAAATALALYVAWFFTAQQARFAVPAVLAFVTLAGLGLCVFHRGWRSAVLAMLLGSAVASLPWRNTGYYVASWLTVSGFMSRTEYVDIGTHRTYLPFIEALQAVTPSDARLMLLFEHRGFYMPREYVIGTPVFQEGPLSPPEHFEEPGRLMTALERERITHVVMAKSLEGPDQVLDSVSRQMRLLQGLDQCILQRRLLPVWESEHYVILAVSR